MSSRQGTQRTRLIPEPGIRQQRAPPPPGGAGVRDDVRRSRSNAEPGALMTCYESSAEPGRHLLSR